ncbi:hypothetical protein [Ilumatobacter nonamiensis]|uniref:hypothetical protein n=1 Tax=Ilumatobacter nonamiensis TaxID=467093 RepID=UPI00034B9ECD|nr:hypothetical protein [Ilumatobacter nonamiensis]
MFESDDLSLDCSTCVAANTTACGDCVVQHLLANDAGPIEFVPAPRRGGLSHTERAVELFSRAGLLDPDPHFVAFDEFESTDTPQMSR